jgi:hypothetical protein
LLLRSLAVLAPAIAVASVASPAVAPASAAAAVGVQRGSTLQTTIFPNDRFTVADHEQLTNRRVNLPPQVCDDTNYSLCDGVAMLNQLDGFDLQPRVTIPFTGPIRVSSIDDNSVYVTGPGGRTGLMQLVWDPATNTLAGMTKAFLQEGSSYRIVVTSRVRDAGGRPIDACGGRCQVRFTTRTATGELERIRRALDDGSSYAAAGISRADRTANFLHAGARTVFPAGSVTEIQHFWQTYADPSKPLQTDTGDALVPNTIAGAGTYAFGSFFAPRYQYRSKTFDEDRLGGLTDGEIPPVPSRVTPRPFGKDRIGFALVLPSGPPPAGGWPVAVYGPGFTRSKYDLFVSADQNAARGIATIATDPAGHSFGPKGQVMVSQGAVSTMFPTYGRGRDLDGDGRIGDGLNDGVGPTDHKTVDAGGRVVGDLPSRKTIDGLRSGLIQTVTDNMALVRMIEAGVDVPGVGNGVLRKTGITYYGISFGGIYGTMLMATDTHLQAGVLNVPGGPIVDIARLSGFRHDLADKLKVSKPNLLNGGPGRNGFTESIPGRLDPPVTHPVRGAIALQESFADSNWYERSGSPETFAPLLRLRPLRGAPQKRVLFQTAYGDQTVPNPTAGTLYRAGELFDRVTYYRNDKTPTYATDPHGFLADPRLAGREQGQTEMITFLASGGTTVVDPDSAGPVFEVPVAIRTDLDCLHYPDPQTGKAPDPQPYPQSGDCH